MNISLPEALKDFVDDQVSARGYSTSSEYVRELIRKDQDRQRLRGLLLAGAASPKAVTARRGLLRPAACIRPTVSAKPVVLRERARRDIDEAVEHYLAKAGPAIALDFIDALERHLPPDRRTAVERVAPLRSTS